MGMDIGWAPCPRDPRCSKASGHRGVCKVKNNPTRLPTGVHCPASSPLPLDAGSGCPRASGHPDHCKGEEDPSLAPAAAAGPAAATLVAAALAPRGSSTEDVEVEAVVVSVADIACELCGSGENDVNKARVAACATLQQDTAVLRMLLPSWHYHGMALVTA